MSRKCRGELWEREGVLLPIQLSRGMTKIDKLSQPCSRTSLLFYHAMYSTVEPYVTAVPYELFCAAAFLVPAAERTGLLPCKKNTSQVGGSQLHATWSRYATEIDALAQMWE